MGNSSRTIFKETVALQIKLLQDGHPLEAFDAYFEKSGVMFANDELFATGQKEARAKQEPFISAAISIQGLITDVNTIASEEICVFRNKTSFTTANNETHQINGLCWQKWRFSKIIEERYYDGEHMENLVIAGILINPSVLISKLN